MFRLRLFNLILAFILVPWLAFAGSPLEDELAVDPLGRGYSTLTDEEVANDGHTEYRTQNRILMSASEVANQIDITEFAILTGPQEQQIWNVLHLGELNPFGVEATIFLNVFGGGSTTISNLQAARIKSISRWVEIGAGNVTPGQVEDARP